MKASFSDELRKAVLNSGMSRYSISLKTGIAQSTLSKFVNGERGISLESVDKLIDILGLEIRPRRRKES
jgi:transcriptional regulator with XRE-family HTH domain